MSRPNIEEKGSLTCWLSNQECKLSPWWSLKMKLQVRIVIHRNHNTCAQISDVIHRIKVAKNSKGLEMSYSVSSPVAGSRSPNYNVTDTTKTFKWFRIREFTWLSNKCTWLLKIILITLVPDGVNLFLTKAWHQVVFF